MKKSDWSSRAVNNRHTKYPTTFGSVRTFSEDASRHTSNVPVHLLHSTFTHQCRQNERGRGSHPHLPPSPPPLNLPAPSYPPNSNYVYHHKAFTLSPHPHKILWNIYIFLLLDLKPSTVVTEILCKSNPACNLYPTPLHYTFTPHHTLTILYPFLYSRVNTNPHI